MEAKKKTDWKKEAKEILEILVYVAISAGVVFQANYGCSRKEDKATDSVKKEVVAHNIQKVR